MIFPVLKSERATTAGGNPWEKAGGHPLTIERLSGLVPDGCPLISPEPYSGEKLSLGSMSERLVSHNYSRKVYCSLTENTSATVMVVP
jgi:hypothetical protein